MNLAFKYQNLYYQFLSIKRQQKSIVINVDTQLLKDIFSVDDIHMTYPKDGNVHLTLNKRDSFKAEVNVNGIKIKKLIFPTKENDVLTLLRPFIKFAKKSIPLEKFRDNEISFPFPTFASVSFPITKAFVGKWFNQKLPKNKYTIIDISHLKIGVINIVICIRGEKAVWSLPLDANVLHRETMKGSPIIELALLHY